MKNIPDTNSPDCFSFKACYVWQQPFFFVFFFLAAAADFSSSPLRHP